MAEIKFYRDAAHEQQVYPAIDPDGIYPGVTVGLANNLASPDGLTDQNTWIYRSTGGELDISDGYAELRTLVGTTESSTIQEKLVLNLRATGVTSATVNGTTFKSQISDSGTYNFIYTPIISYSSDLVYSLNKITFGNHVNQTTGTYTFTFAAIIDKEDSSNVVQSFNENTFISKVSATPNNYTFTYNGSNWQLNGSNVTMSQYGITTKGTEVNGTSIVINYASNSWKYGNNVVAMSDYGIVTTGTETLGDTIAINYTDNEWQLNETSISLSTYGITIVSGTPVISDNIQIVYVKEQMGVVVVSNPSALYSVGMNQFNKNGSQKFSGYTIDSSGKITSSSGFYVVYFKCLGGETYTIYNDVASSVGRIGYLQHVPSTGSTVTLLDLVTSSEWCDSYVNDTHKKHVCPDEDGYLVVATSNIDDLCCHLSWEGVNDDVYESYFDATLTIPYTDENGNTISEYGLANLDNSTEYYDYIDFQNSIWHKATNRMAYSAENLATVQAMGVPYIYDDTWIYYGITGIDYQLTEMSSAYQISNYGTEEFLNTDGALIATVFYQDNLRDKIRFSMEVIDNKVSEINRDEGSVNYYRNMYPSVMAVLKFDYALREILGIDMDTFSSTNTYDAGDYVIYDLKIWKCIQDITQAGDWKGNSFTVNEVTKTNVSASDTVKVAAYLASHEAPLVYKLPKRILVVDPTSTTNTYSVIVVYQDLDGIAAYQAINTTMTSSELSTNFGLTFSSFSSSNKYLVELTNYWAESYLFKAD